MYTTERVFLTDAELAVRALRLKALLCAGRLFTQ
jgi:hypothetical protein